MLEAAIYYGWGGPAPVYLKYSNSGKSKILFDLPINNNNFAKQQILEHKNMIIKVLYFFILLF